MTRRLLVLLLVLTASGAAPADAQTPANTWSPAGPAFSTVLALERDPANPGDLLAGLYFGGLYRSTDYGYSWTHVATEFSSRSIFSIARSGDGIIYVGTFQGGVYRSDDRGATWTSVNTGLTDLDVYVVAVDPFNANVVLASTSNGGLFRSENAGASWIRVDGAEPALQGKAIAFHPSQPGIVYLGTIGRGAFRSVDGGRTFDSFNDGMSAASILSLRFGAPPSRELYAATDNGAFKLRSDASSWTDITGGLPPFPLSDILPHPIFEHMAFAGTFVGTYVIANDDTVPSWVQWTDVATRILAVDPSGSVFHAGSIHGGLQATFNFGQTWYESNAGMQNLFVGALGVVDGGAAGPIVFAGSDFAVHRGIFGVWDTFFNQKQGIFDIQPDPITQGTLYIGTERSGVWKSIDWGTSWTASSTNLVPAQVFSLGQAADGRTLFAGTSSGLFLSGDNGASWTTGNATQLGIVLSIAPDPTRYPLLFVGGANGQVLRSEDGGFSFAAASKGLPSENIVSLVTAPWEKTYAVTASGGLYATSDSGANWFAAKTGAAEPAVSIAADPQRSWILYLGTSGGGVYKSESGSLEWTAANAGLTSPFVFALAVDPVAPLTVYAGTLDGVFKSADGASTWTRRSAGLSAGAITSVLIDPSNPQVVYASVQDSGIYRSADGALTWHPISGGLPVAGAMPLLVNSLQPSQLFAGTALKGVYRSDDAGASWNASSFGMALFVRGLAIDPVTPSTLFAGSLSAGVFKSTDAAATWTNVGLRDRNVFKLAIDPQHPQTVYAATSRGLSRSADGGASWRALGQSSAFVHAMVVDPRNRNRVFTGTTAGSIYRSVDGGETWELTGSGLPPYTVFALAIDATTGALYAAPERQGIWRSANDGASWAALPGGPLDTAFVSSLTVGPGHEVYAGTLGAGVFISNGGNWVVASAGLASPQIADVEVLGNGTLLAATFDAGVFRSLDGGLSWSWASSGLSTSRVTALTAAPTAGGAYAATPDGVFVTADAGLSWQGVQQGMRGVSTWSVALDPAAPNLLFAATNGRGVFRSRDAGATWNVSTAGMTNLDARVVAIGPAPGHLYAATLGGGVARSRDGGLTWSGGATRDLVDNFVLAVVVNPANPSVVYVGTAGRGVLKSTNSGIDWHPVTNGLGSLFLLSLTIDKQHPDTLFAGTADAGVFYTTNGGTSWHPLNAGLFNPVVTSLALAPGDSNRLYAGTEGGGVFTNELSLPAATCTYAVSGATQFIGSAATTLTVEITTGASCPWRVESGAEWLTVAGAGSRSGSGALTIDAAINIGQDARSGVVTLAGQPVVIVQKGLATLYRLSVTRVGTGSGHVASDWIGIDCGADCEQLYTDHLPVVLTATANAGSVFAGWEGDGDCVDGALTMAFDRACVARFEETDDFDEDGLPNMWEASFGLDAGSGNGQDGPDGDPDGDGRTNAEELEDGTHPRGFVTRYFANGRASATHRTRIDLFNAGADTARVLVHLVPDAGERVSEYRLLAPLSRAEIETTLLVQPGLIQGGFAVTIESDRALVSERTLTQQTPHATEAAPAETASAAWFVPAGNTRDGQTVQYAIFNPGTSAATVDIAYLPSGRPAVSRSHVVDPGARLVIDVGTDASATNADVAAGISSSVPVVVEATARSASGDAVLGSLASAAPGYLQYLADGHTGSLVATAVDVLNPTGSSAQLTFTYVLPGGGIVQTQHTVGAFASDSIDPATDDSLLTDTSFGLIASAATPFIMTGSTWWPGSSGDWYEGGATAAATAAGTRWAIAGGEVGGPSNSETEIAVTNVSPRAGTLRVRLVFDDGTSAVKDFALPAVAHLTVAVAQAFPEAVWKRFSAVIESVGEGGAPPEIVVEHASFTSPDGTPRSGGTRVLATIVSN